MPAGDDVHLAGHAGEQVFRRIREIEHDRVALCFRIGRRQNRGDLGVELAATERIHLQRRHPCRSSPRRHLPRSLRRARKFLCDETVKSSLPSETSSPSIAFMPVSNPSIGARISEVRICASSFLAAASRLSRLRSRSIRSASSCPRRRTTSLFDFSNSTTGTLLNDVSRSSRFTASSATRSGSDDGSGSCARSVAAWQVGLRLFQLPRGCLRPRSWRTAHPSARFARSPRVRQKTDRPGE